MTDRHGSGRGISPPAGGAAYSAVAVHCNNAHKQPRTAVGGQQGPILVVLAIMIEIKYFENATLQSPEGLWVDA
jgi:hypothetical protein